MGLNTDHMSTGEVAELRAGFARMRKFLLKRLVSVGVDASCVYEAEDVPSHSIRCPLLFDPQWDANEDADSSGLSICWTFGIYAGELATGGGLNLCQISLERLTSLGLDLRNDLTDYQNAASPGTIHAGMFTIGVARSTLVDPDHGYDLLITLTRKQTSREVNARNDSSLAPVRPDLKPRTRATKGLRASTPATQKTTSREDALISALKRKGVNDKAIAALLKGVKS